jgi:Ca2+-binding RTX toxin-like protein
MRATGGGGYEAYAGTVGIAPRITDFRREEGDKLSIPVNQPGLFNAIYGTPSRPMIFRGEVTGSLSTLGAALPGASDLGSGFVQVFWTREVSDGAAKTVLLFDFDCSLTVSAGDLVIDFVGTSNTNILLSDFLAGTFTAIAGTAAGETINGTAARDLLYGVGGDDFIYGFAGTDELFGGAGNDTIDGGADADLIRGEGGDDRLIGGGSNGNYDQVYGGDGADIISATGYAQLFGEAGNDTITVAQGSAHGGEGNDTLNGSNGFSATLRGDAGNDTITTGDSTGSTAYGGYGDDTITGGSGNDNLHGDWGADRLVGGLGNDILRAGQYSQHEGDAMTSEAPFRDDLSGGDGNDTLYSGIGGAELNGGAGDDIIFISAFTNSPHQTTPAGIDVATGGLGADHFVVYGGGYDPATRTQPGDPRGGAPSTFGHAAQITDFNRAQGDKLVVPITSPGLLNDYDSQLNVNVAKPLLFRGEISPSFYTANAVLPGDDLGTGFIQSWWTRTADGKTVFIMDIDADLRLTSKDLVIELTGASELNLLASDFIAGIFVAVAGTAGADTLTGTTVRDLIYSGGGNDVVRAGAGNDNIYGGAGDDLLEGEAGDDLVYGEAGNDTIHGGTSTGNYDNLYGGEGDDTITGDFVQAYGEAGIDRITIKQGHANGGEGNDFLNGVNGFSATLRGDAGDDTIVMGDFTGSIGANQAYGSRGNDSITGGLGHDHLKGDEGADIIRGGAGNDTLEAGYSTYIYSGDAMTSEAPFRDDLSGGDGNDILYSGLGAADLRGEGGNDVIFMAAYSHQPGLTAPRSIDVATGGLGADHFAVYGVGFDAASRTFASDGRTTSPGTFGYAPQITDFSRAQGDKLVIPTNAPGVLNFLDLQLNAWIPKPLVFRGEMNPSLYTANAVLPGSDLGTGFVQAWWTRIDGKTVFVMDVDADLRLTSKDLVFELTGTSEVNLLASDFYPGIFVAIAGTANADVMTGLDTRDLIYSAGGNDTVNGQGGDDDLWGGLGDDQLNGGLGNDRLEGEAGNDTLTGAAGTDTLRGGDGDDSLVAVTTPTTCTAGPARTA